MPTYKFIIGTYPSIISRKIVNRTGQQFTYLRVIGFGGLNEYQQALWHCLCKCGNGTTLPSSSLIKRKSCGCFAQERGYAYGLKHGESRKTYESPEHKAYSRSKQRCNRPHYKKRGIQFRFDSYSDFLEAIGRQPTPQHTVERINNKGHYQQGNLKWALPSGQARNRDNNVLVTVGDTSQCIPDWEQQTGIDRRTIRSRLVERKWCAECAVTILPNQGTCIHRE